MLTRPDDAKSELQKRLLALPFEAFARLVGLLLEALGYQDVQLAGRAHWKGRNRDGGADLVATLAGGIAPRKVIVQAKQFERLLFQRHIDELRGVALRLGASEAILVTTGPISKAIDRSSRHVNPLPLRIVDGAELLELLVLHHIGVTETGEIDEPRLARLESEARGNGREDCPGRPDLLLTIQLHKVPTKLQHATRTNVPNH
jgi:restriction endonuclease Mrr